MEINLEDFKSHLQFEEGMDDAMLEFYLDMGKKYAKRATDDENSSVAYYIASIFFGCIKCQKLKWRMPLML